MTDPVTTLIIAGSGAVASKEILTKLLGPTADYVGEGTKDLVKRAAENLGRIFTVASAKVGKRLDANERVNPRVFKHVWDEGRFVEDAICTEYFAGILASARSEDGHDDSAVPQAALVKSLSSNQLRLHFIIYSLLAEHRFDDRIAESNQFWSGLQMFVPARELLESMQLSGVDGENHLVLALAGLADHQLIGEGYAVRIRDLRRGRWKRLDDDSLIITPNERGAALFFRAIGLRGLHPELITSINVAPSLSEDVKSAISLPQHSHCWHARGLDPLKSLRHRLDTRLEEVEESMDDFRTDILKWKRSHEKIRTG